ncbi:hypothetical protein KI387_023220 [Taxus chinensis]|uniref:Uncharacterized protein n=1 Tax=Taxus chinensis TaxID=29808 RepID=A0AA38G3G5_TAXCH|nr:hypothetical protein KI387_023220 [Taxus chinensis]
MSLKVVERSYCTPNGWRLATYEEAKNGVESIKEQGLLGKWDRARLLDGWISGPGYNFQMKNDFRWCMGYMLIIQTQPTSGSAYVDVSLGDLGKEVALLLCAEDWNLEVIYWLFNCWSKSELMDIRDLRDGNIPDAVKFREMNVKICKLAKNLGNLVGEASEKAGKKMYYGHSSIKDVMCGLSEFLKEDPDAAEFVASNCGRVFKRDSYVKYFSPLSVELSYDAWIEIAEAFWSFFSDSFACSFVKAYACNCVRDISIVNAENNFIVASEILFYLVKFQCEIIHAPLQHDGRAEECAPKIFRYLIEKASGDPKCLKEMLQDNAMWRCYTDIGNYDLLHMLLIRITEEEVRDATLVVNMLLQCGARPRPANTIGCCENKTTALHCAAGRDYNEDLGLELAKSFLQKCDEKERKELIDATDEKEMTALHRACEKGNARICGLLLDYGAALHVRDDKGMTPIHHAAMHDQVMNVFIESPHFSYCVDIQDNEGKRPIDTMIARSSEAELVAKVVSFSKQPQDYFTKLNWEHLVPQFLQKGSIDMVSQIFQAGAKLPDVYDGGKTVLHFAAMCQDANDSLDMFKLILKHSPRKHDLVAKRDRKGRSALHEVALRGDYYLSYFLLKENSKIVNITDRDGRNPLYEAVKGCRDHQDIQQTCWVIFAARYGYRRFDRP